MTLTHGSLFAGIGGSLGFVQAGIETRWHVELDTDCQRVLRHHFPDDLVLGDIRDCGVHNLPPVDVISFGSPCQDLSTAGKRAGLMGERSGLFYEAIRIVKELRPAWAIWENVVGALSSNGGRDFGAALDALADAGALDIAWRVLDAQWFGVAQRRRRVFVVADFRGERAGQVLFESESVSGDTPPSRAAGEGFTHETTASLRASGAGTSRAGESRGQDPVVAVPLVWKQGYRNNPSDDNYVVGAVTSKWAKGSGGPAGDEVQNLVVAQPLRAGRRTAGSHGDAGNVMAVSINQRREGRLRAVHGSLNGHQNNTQFDGVLSDGVRRLTPIECSRLQGFPDDWLDGLGLSDGKKYQMLGNAWAVPVIRWIGERLVAAQ